MKFRYDQASEKLIVSESTRTEYHQLNLWLTRKVKGYQYMPAYKMGIWRGDQSYFDNGKVNLGLWKECLKALREVGTGFGIENREDFPLNRDVTLENVENFCKVFFKNHQVRTKDGQWIKFEPYDYQVATAFKVLKNRYCMAEIATSGGKSLVLSIIIFYILKNINPDAKFLIIVPTITLVTQFYENIMEYNYGFNYLTNWETRCDFRSGNIDPIRELEPDYEPAKIKMEEIMSDRPRRWQGVDQPNIYIGTYQSLDKWPKSFFTQFHTVAVDEAHMTKAQTLTSILKKTFGHAYNRFGVSGTFPSDDSLEILTIQSVLGPRVTQIEADELIKRGAITQMQIKGVILNHQDPELNTRLHEIKKLGAGRDAFQIEKDTMQASEKRLDFIKKLVDKCQDNTLILFHNIDYGTRIFDKLSKELPDKEFFYIDGEVSGKRREEIKKQMEITNDKVKVLIASFGTLSTGVSITAIFNVVFADSFKSEQIIIQSIGRALRKHQQKKVATIFDLVDVFDGSKMNNILYRHFIERQKFYLARNYPFTTIKLNL